MVLFCLQRQLVSHCPALRGRLFILLSRPLHPAFLATGASLDTSKSCQLYYDHIYFFMKYFEEAWSPLGGYSAQHEHHPIMLRDNISFFQLQLNFVCKYRTCAPACETWISGELNDTCRWPVHSGIHILVYRMHLPMQNM